MSMDEFAAPVGSVEHVLAAARAARLAVDGLRTAVAEAGEDDEVVLEATAALMELSDVAMAAAVSGVGAARSSGAAERSAGLDLVSWLQCDGRRTGVDARFVLRAEALLRGLPVTAARFAAGLLSWPQVRAVVAACKPLRNDQLAAVDAVVAADAADRRAGVEVPDELVDRVAEVAERLRVDLAERREQASVDSSFVAVQARLDGGAQLTAGLDDEGAAIVMEGMDAAADRPTADDADDDPYGLSPRRTRGAQRAEALVRMAQHYLETHGRPAAAAASDDDEADLDAGSGDAAAGADDTADGASTDIGGADVGSTAWRPPRRVRRARPLLHVIVDPDRGGARILARMNGRPKRVTQRWLDSLACDAVVQPVVRRNGRWVAVGVATSSCSESLRAALWVRDQGCRFPGCEAPPQWTDAHRVIPETSGGRYSIANCVLLCRRCHRRVHARGWSLLLDDDGTLTVTRGTRSLRSPPRASPAAPG